MDTLPSASRPKTCSHCAVSFDRPKGMSFRDWEKRRFCSRPCRDANMTAPPSWRPPVPSEFANPLFLKRLVRYGFGHDGLPGMSAAAFVALADRLEMAA